MKKFEMAQLEVMRFEENDVVVASGGCHGDCSFVCQGECQSVCDLCHTVTAMGK